MAEVTTNVLHNLGNGLVRDDADQLKSDLAIDTDIT